MLTFSPNDMSDINASLSYANSQLEIAKADGYLSNFYISVKIDGTKIVFSSREDIVDADFIENNVIPTIKEAKDRIEHFPATNAVINQNIDLIRKNSPRLCLGV